MMWVGSPAFFTVVLLKAIWFGGVVDQNDNHFSIPPQVAVTAQAETSLKQCEIDGVKWELAGEVAVLKQDVPVMNGKWQCVIVATGGLST